MIVDDEHIGLRIPHTTTQWSSVCPISPLLIFSCVHHRCASCAKSAAHPHSGTEKYSLRYTVSVLGKTKLVPCTRLLCRQVQEVTETTQTSHRRTPLGLLYQVPSNQARQRAAFGAEFENATSETFLQGDVWPVAFKAQKRSSRWRGHPDSPSFQR